MKNAVVLLCLFVGLVLAAGCSGDDAGPTVDPTANRLPDLGKTWTRVAMPSEFTNRTHPGVAVLNGRLYVAAGQLHGFNGGDCWSSSDGTTWIRESDNPFSVGGLRDFGMTAHDGKLWIHGGVSLTGNVQNKTLTSTNGRDWVAVTADDIRWDHGMLSFGGKLWAIAGYQRPPDVITNCISSSSDGIGWTVAGAPGFAPRLLPGVAVHAGKMWIVGGYLADRNVESPMTNDVWSSTDGITWTCVTPAAPFCPRGAIGLVAAGNRLYAVGGAFFDQYGNRVGTNDVWKSYDGATWEQVAVTTPYPVRTWNTVAAFNDGLYVIAGEAGNSYPTNDIWYSK